MARIKGPKKTNRYPDEFKVKAVAGILGHIEGNRQKLGLYDAADSAFVSWFRIGISGMFTG
jgi:hypothetical protein